MTLHNFLLFISACVALALIPGPDMAYMLARCIAQGRRAGVLAALGFNLGVRQFSRAFSLDVGMSPAKAIESLRVEAARSQIETGSSQLEAIARRIGFGSVDRMRHAFVRAYGQTPQELRRIARNER